MLVERGLRVMNIEVVGDAYAIASNYLRRTGAIPDSFATDERLLQTIVRCFSAAKRTGCGSPTRRSRSSRPASWSNSLQAKRISWKPPSTVS